MVTSRHALFYILAGLVYLVPVLPLLFRLFNRSASNRAARTGMAIGRFVVGSVMGVYSLILLALAPVALAVGTHALVQLVLLREVGYHAQLACLLPLGAIIAVFAVISGVMTAANGNFTWVPHIIDAIRGRATPDERLAAQKSAGPRRTVDKGKGWDSSLTAVPDIVDGLADMAGDAGHGDSGDDGGGGDASGGD